MPAFAAAGFSFSHSRGSFGSTGELARPSGGGATNEDLLVIYEPPGTKLLPSRKIGPRVYCAVDCSVRATIRLDLPGKRDPKPAVFESGLVAGHIYTATISPTSAERSRLIKSLSASRLLVEIAATDQAQRTDTDRRTFRFREVGQ